MYSLTTFGFMFISEPFWIMLLLLFAGHALADYPLQGQFLSDVKNRLVPGVAWQWGLFCHALIHSLFVFLITGSFGLAMCELVLHACIDYSKGRRWISFNTDQALHFLCKILWAVVVWRLWASL